MWPLGASPVLTSTKTSPSSPKWDPQLPPPPFARQRTNQRTAGGPAIRVGRPGPACLPSAFPETTISLKYPNARCCVDLHRTRASSKSKRVAKFKWAQSPHQHLRQHYKQRLSFTSLVKIVVKRIVLLHQFPETLGGVEVRLCVLQGHGRPPTSGRCSPSDV